jgi:hypothetical protein
MDTQSIHLRSKKSRQRGSSDHETVMTILVVITLLTIGYLILGWFRAEKDEKVDRLREQYIESHRRKPSRQEERGPSGHQVVL